MPSRNSTFVTVPSGSLADAEIVMLGFQVKIAASTGAVMLTTGAVLLELTVIVEAKLVVTPPRSSVARAVSE